MKTRREFLASLASVPAVGPRAHSRDANRPNILFLLTDDHRWDALGCMGNKVIRTPHLDRLAADGTLFLNNFCSTAICMASRASIFTGLHERSHGISRFDLPLTPQAFARGYPALLRKAGYRTGFIGKYGVGNTMPAAEFDYWKGFPGQGRYFVEHNGRTVHLTNLMGDQAVEFLESGDAKQPFCLSVSFKAPHAQDEDPRQYLYDPGLENLYQNATVPVPKTATRRYYEELPPFLQNSEGHIRWKKRFATPEEYQKSVKAYYRLITGVDNVVGRIRKKLDEIGQAANTVIIFTSDNGYYLGERWLADKWYLHEESVRTPLIIFDPRLPQSRRGRRRREMTLNLDLAPTMLDVAGLKPPASMQGRSLLPLVRGERISWRTEFFYSHLFQHPGIPKSEGIRNERWMYARYIETDPLYEELYDLRRDPFEEHNLAHDSSASEQLQAMRKRWQAWRDALARWSPDVSWQDPPLS
jgi:Arylsulfatase A and related enzymes